LSVRRGAARELRQQERQDDLLAGGLTADALDVPPGRWTDRRRCRDDRVAEAEESIVGGAPLRHLDALLPSIG
jgi:hypothetical protein